MKRLLSTILTTFFVILSFGQIDKEYGWNGIYPTGQWLRTDSIHATKSDFDTSYSDYHTQGNALNIYENDINIGDITIDTGTIYRAIANMAEISDTLIVEAADGEKFIQFRKDDGTDLWDFRLDGDTLELYNNSNVLNHMRLLPGGITKFLDTIDVKALRGNSDNLDVIANDTMKLFTGSESGLYSYIKVRNGHGIKLFHDDGVYEQYIRIDASKNGILISDNGNVGLVGNSDYSSNYSNNSYAQWGAVKTEISDSLQDAGKIKSKKYVGDTIHITSDVDSFDVSNHSIVMINPSSSITISGFKGGVAGQHLDVVVIQGNTTTLKHNQDNGGNSQKLFLPDEADMDITFKGGFRAICDGADWYILSISQ